MVAEIARRKAGNAPEPMIPLTGGRFWMGSDDYYPEEGPSREAEVGAFAIDPAPVTNRDFAEFVAATGHVTLAERVPDAALYPDFLAKTSKEDMRLRFFGLGRVFSDKLLVRLTQLDYSREMAFVALEDGALCSVARLSADPDHEAAEYALLVRSDLQGRGLGWAMLHRLIEYAKADGLKRIEGVILSENTKMLKMCREIGFQLTPEADGTGTIRARLDIEALP